MPNSTALVLLIDDDEMLTEVLVEYLTPFGFVVDVSHQPLEGIEKLNQKDYQLLLLDVMLPQMSGLAVCRLVRETNDIPIIMLTAKGELSDKVLGFEYGADDYLPKPFEPQELIARMKSLLRRQEKLQTKQQDLIDQLVPPFLIDGLKKQVRIEGRVIELTTLEFEILFLLYQHAGEVMDRDHILKHVKGFTDDVSIRTRAVDNSISRLRRKLDNNVKSQRFIMTLYGQGYCFVKQD